MSDDTIIEDDFQLQSPYSKTMGYILDMDGLVASIASVLGDKYAVWVAVPNTGGGSDNGEAQAYSDGGGDSGGGDGDESVVMVNIAQEKLEAYHGGTWKPSIGVSRNGCWTEIESYCSDKLTNLSNDTIATVSCSVLIPEKQIEEGSVLKAESIGELCDSDGIKRAKSVVELILAEGDIVWSEIGEADLPRPPKNTDNMEMVEFIISQLEKVRSYIGRVVSKGKGVLNSLMLFESFQSALAGAYAELVLFSSRGDFVAHTYYSKPKASTALQTFNSPTYGTICQIEGTVPNIIENQQNILDMWNLVNTIDESEFQRNSYLENAYNDLETLKDLCLKQCLSKEVEDMGSRISSIALNITSALSDTKSNQTFDTLMTIQQRLQLGALDGLTPMNIIERALGAGWGGDYKSEYPTIIEKVGTALQVYKSDNYPEGTK